MSYLDDVTNMLSRNSITFLPKHKSSHSIGLESSSAPLRKRKCPHFTFHKHGRCRKCIASVISPLVNREATWRQPHVTPCLWTILCLSFSVNPCCYLLDWAMGSWIYLNTLRAILLRNGLIDELRVMKRRWNNFILYLSLIILLTVEICKPLRNAGQRYLMTSCNIEITVFRYVTSCILVDEHHRL